MPRLHTGLPVQHYDFRPCPDAYFPGPSIYPYSWPVVASHAELRQKWLLLIQPRDRLVVGWQHLLEYRFFTLQGISHFGPLSRPLRFLELPVSESATILAKWASLSGIVIMKRSISAISQLKMPSVHFVLNGAIGFSVIPHGVPGRVRFIIVSMKRQRRMNWSHGYFKQMLKALPYAETVEELEALLPWNFKNRNLI